MKNLVILFTVVFISFLVWSCSDEPTSVVQSENSTLQKSGPSANGQGTLIMPWGDFQTFSFHARDFNGNITGSIQFNMHGAYQAHGTIDCMVVEGNQATLSGYITHWPEEWEEWSQYFPDGYFFWFQVVDNGEGANAPPDEFSDIYVPISYFPCDIVPPDPIPTMPILNGNFQVKP